MQFRRISAQAAALSAATLILASCSLLGGGEPEPQQEAKGEIKFSGKTSPLTGLEQASEPGNPVYYVKIENTNGGEPQYGENHADMP